jgi:MoaA/NifB/PqqE/SkfB family radical SAM enzyme
MKNKYGFQFYHWHIEPSSKCAVKCPRCPRTEMPKDIPWLQKELTLEQFQKCFTEELLKTQVKRLTMCGDVGDPIYCKDYLKICRYVKETNPDIHIYTITNGSYKKKEWWEELRDISNEKDTIAFSIDGYDNASNNLYRVNSDWDSIIEGVTTVTQNKKAHVTWATIVFSFNQDHLQHIQDMAKRYGCDSLQITKSIKFGSRFGTYNNEGDNDSLEPRNEFISQSGRYERYSIPLSDRVLNNQDYLETNKQKWQEIVSQYKNDYIIPLCMIGNRGLYLNADGQIYPCSWVAAPYFERQSFITGKKIKGKDSLFRKYEHLMNIKTRTLEEIVNDDIWEKLFNSFKSPDKAFIECEEKCNKCSVSDESYSVGYLTN